MGNKKVMARVYIPNRSGHNFADAKRFGEIIYITEGFINKTKINNMYRACTEAMQDAKPDDYIIISGIGALNMIAAAVFARITGRLNLLMFNNGRYESRELDIDALLGQGKDDA